MCARLSVALLLLAAGCPTPPEHGGAGGTGGEGGEDAAGADDRALPASVLDPWSGEIVARAAEAAPAGGRVRAILVRADVATPAQERGLAWTRVGYVLGPFGLRRFERSARSIDDPGHGLTPPEDTSAAAVARAVARDVAWLTAADCEALPETACAPLISEELVRSEDRPATDVQRVAVTSVAAILVTADGDPALVELSDDSPAVTPLH